MLVLTSSYMHQLTSLSLFLMLFTYAGLTVLATTDQEAIRALSHYDLSIRIIPDQHKLQVTGTWELPPSAIERNSVEFYLSEKMEDLTIDILEPYKSGPLKLNTPVSEGGDNKWTVELRTS